jgi:hypothetical protein
LQELLVGFFVPMFTQTFVRRAYSGLEIKSGIAWSTGQPEPQPWKKVLTMTNTNQKKSAGTFTTT